jgi:hypothetical protein
MKKICLSAILICLISLLSTGCLFQGKKRNEWQPIEQKVAPVVHKVQWPEERLMIIAKWYTGDAQNWEALANANPNVNPDSLAQGTKIFIPAELVKHQEPMTQVFLMDFLQNEKKQESPPKKPPSPGKKDVIDFEVFGPK